MPDTLPVSVVISTYEEGPGLRDTVASLLDAAEQPAQIVIVDDGSTDGSCDGAWPAPVTMVRRRHRGIAPARNEGAEIASQPNLVFLDAHCGVDTCWLQPLCDTLQRHPTALVGPAMSDVRDPHRAGCGATIVSPLFEYRWNVSYGHDVHAVQIVPGGCLAVRRNLFVGAGGFGPFEGFGLEDVDLSLCWHAAGRPVLGAPSSRVQHRFRQHANYQWERQQWVANVLRTAIRHLSGDRLRKTILACAQYPAFAIAIADLTTASIAGPSKAHREALKGVWELTAAWDDPGG